MRGYFYIETLYETGRVRVTLPTTPTWFACYTFDAGRILERGSWS